MITQWIANEHVNELTDEQAQTQKSIAPVKYCVEPWIVVSMEKWQAMVPPL